MCVCVCVCIYIKLGCALVGRAFLNKAVIQLSVDGWGCTSSWAVIWTEETQSLGLWASRTAVASAPIFVVSPYQYKPQIQQ